MSLKEHLPHHKNRKEFEEKYPDLAEVSYEVRLYYAVCEGVPLTDAFDIFDAFEHVRSCAECWRGIEHAHKKPLVIRARYRRSS